MHCGGPGFLKYPGWGVHEKLHKKELKSAVLNPKNEFVLERIETENPVLKGARYYRFVE